MRRRRRPGSRDNGHEMPRLLKLTALLLAGVFLSLGAEEPKDEDARTMKKFIDAYKILEQNTADPFDLDKAFYEGAIPGLLHHLDPHSVFFDPVQFEQVKQMES